MNKFVLKNCFNSVSDLLYFPKNFTYLLSAEIDKMYLLKCLSSKYFEPFYFLVEAILCLEDFK